MIRKLIAALAVGGVLLALAPVTSAVAAPAATCSIEERLESVPPGSLNSLIAHASGLKAGGASILTVTNADGTYSLSVTVKTDTAVVSDRVAEGDYSLVITAAGSGKIKCAAGPVHVSAPAAVYSITASQAYYNWIGPGDPYVGDLYQLGVSWNVNVIADNGALYDVNIILNGQAYSADVGVTGNRSGTVNVVQRWFSAPTTATLVVVDYATNTHTYASTTIALTPPPPA